MFVLFLSLNTISIAQEDARHLFDKEIESEDAWMLEVEKTIHWEFDPVTGIFYFMLPNDSSVFISTEKPCAFGSDYLSVVGDFSKREEFLYTNWKGRVYRFSLRIGVWSVEIKGEGWLDLVDKNENDPLYKEICK